MANLLSFVGVSVTFLISIGFEYLVTLVTTEGVFVTVSVVAAFADLVAVERLRVAINDLSNWYTTRAIYTLPLLDSEE